MSTETSTTAPSLSTGVWQIDPGHSDISFTVRHMMMAKVRGGFSRYSGEIEVGEDLADSTVWVEIESASMDTRSEARDGHIRGAGFFDAENHPLITFRSSEVRLSNPASGVVVGELTIRGNTRQVELAVEHTGVGADPFGTVRAGFVVDVTVDRRDFGVDFNVPLSTGGVLVGNEVAVHMEIEALRVAAPGA